MVAYQKRVKEEKRNGGNSSISITKLRMLMTIAKC
jgi:hypothetical protein